MTREATHCETQGYLACLSESESEQGTGVVPGTGPGPGLERRCGLELLGRGPELGHELDQPGQGPGPGASGFGLEEANSPWLQRRQFHSCSPQGLDEQTKYLSCLSESESE